MVDVANEAIENLDFLYPFSLAVLYHLMDKDFSIKVIILLRSAQTGRHIALPKQAIFQCFRLFPCGFKLCIQGQDLSLQRLLLLLELLGEHREVPGGHDLRGSVLIYPGYQAVQLGKTFFRPLFIRRRPSVLCLLSTVGGLQKAGGYGFLILMDRLNPELQTGENIGIKNIIADIMCGTLIAELSIAAAIVMPVWFLDLAFCPETHRPATTGAFERPGENLCCLVLHRTAACGDLFLHTVKNIFRNDRLMSPLDTYPLAGVLADTLLIFVGDICFPVMDRIFDVGFILQNAFDLGYGPGAGFSLRVLAAANGRIGENPLSFGKFSLER